MTVNEIKTELKRKDKSLGALIRLRIANDMEVRYHRARQDAFRSILYWISEEEKKGKDETFSTLEQRRKTA